MKILPTLLGLIAFSFIIFIGLNFISDRTNDFYGEQETNSYDEAWAYWREVNDYGHQHNFGVWSTIDFVRDEIDGPSDTPLVKFSYDGNKSLWPNQTSDYGTRDMATYELILRYCTVLVGAIILGLFGYFTTWAIQDKGGDSCSEPSDKCAMTA